MKPFQMKIKGKFFYRKKERIQIQITLTNCSKQSYYIRLEPSPFLSMQGNGIFLYQGKKFIEYDGVYEKEVDQWGADVICLRGKESIKRDINLEDMFEIKNSGCYGILGKIRLYYVGVEKENAGQISWSSLIVEAKRMHFLILEKRAVKTLGERFRRDERKKRELDIVTRPYPEPEIRFEKEAEFDAWCRKERREEISEAIREAHYELIYYIKSCTRQLAGLKEKSDLGQYYEVLLMRLRKERICYRYDMEMAENCYAYTFRNVRTIWLGTGMLAAGISGENSRIGILMYELVRAVLGIAGKEDERLIENCFVGWNEETVWQNTEKAGITEFGGPKIIVFEGKLYLFYMDWNGSLREAVMEEPGKQKDYVCGFPETEILACHPEAVVYENRLYLFYIPYQEERLYYTYRKNGRWMPGRPIKDRDGKEIRPVYPSKPVVYQDRIYLVYWKKGARGLYMTSRGKFGWSSERKIVDLEGGKTPFQPSLAVSGGELYMIYGVAASSILYYGIYRGAEHGWEMGRTISPNLGISFLAKGAMETVEDENGFYVLISEQYGGIIGIRMHYNQFLERIIWTEGRQIVTKDCQRGQRYTQCSSVRWREEVWTVYQKDNRSIILNRRKY